MENLNPPPRTRLKPLRPLRHPLKDGYRFNPTRQKLIFYLHCKLARLPYPEHIQDCDDIYGEKEGIHEPWNLLDASDNTGHYFFVFTTLKKISNNCDSSKRIQRKAGVGTWHVNASTDVKDYKGKLIGLKKYYKYTGSSSKHGKWTMHEFSLPHKQSPGDVVLCVIGCTTKILIPDEPESSAIFDKQFSDKRMQPSIAPYCANPNSVVATNCQFLKSLNAMTSEKRMIMLGENQQISRKRTFEQQTELGSLMAVVQQQLSGYRVEDQQDSRKRIHCSSIGGLSSVSAQSGFSDQHQKRSGTVMEAIQGPLAAAYPIEAMPLSSYDLLHTMQQTYYSNAGGFSSVSAQSGFSDQHQTRSGTVIGAIREPLAAAYPIEKFPQQEAMLLSSHDVLHTMQQPLFSGSEDAYRSTTVNCFDNPNFSLKSHGTSINSLQDENCKHTLQIDTVAEEGHRQFKDVMEDVEKTAADRGIPVEDYFNEILKNI